MQTCACPVHTCSVSVGSYKLCSGWFRGPCFLVILHLLGLLHSFCFLFHKLPWALWGERFNGDIPFGAECPRLSHFQHNVWLWFSIIVLFCWRGKLLWWWLNKPEVTNEYSRRSLGVILSLWFLLVFIVVCLCFVVADFSLSSIVRFRPVFLSYLFSGSWIHKQCCLWVPFCGVGLMLDQLLVVPLLD